MLVILALAACRPTETRIEIRDDALFVDGDRLGSVANIDRRPLDGDLPALADALGGLALLPTVIEVPGDSAWYRARTLAQTATGSGRSELYFARGGDRYGPTRAAIGRWEPRCAAPFVVTGAAPVVRLDLQHGPDGDWILASARFMPTVDGRPLDTPEACWTGPPCAEMFPDGPLRAVCDAGGIDGAPERVTLGGVVGCAAPIAKPGAGGEWADELANTLTSWGLPARTEITLSPEPTVPYGRVADVLGAVAAARLPFPILPEGMIQGNDGPPACDAMVRDAAGLAAATARWYGANAAKE